MQIIEEKVVQKAIQETRISTESREDVINNYLDTILDFKSELQSLKNSYDRTNKLVLSFMIQNNFSEPSLPLFEALKQTNQAGLRFLAHLKKSDSYTGIKSTVKGLENSIREFQEIYDDYSLKVNPDDELMHLLNEAERTHKGSKL